MKNLQTGKAAEKRLWICFEGKNMDSIVGVLPDEIRRALIQKKG